MIISRTPFRISFSGGGTDLPSFYSNNGYGCVVSTSIASYLHVILKRHTPFFDERIRLNYSETEMVNDISEIKNQIMQECLKFLNIDDRIYISTISDVPAMTGLGSSSTFCVGLLNALYKFKGIPVSSGRLAEEASHIEIELLGRPMGKQDHYAAAYGGLNFIQFFDDESVSVRAINSQDDSVKAIFESMMAFWMRSTRPSESVLAEQDSNHKENTDILVGMRDQAGELRKQLANEPFSLERFAEVIHENWIQKKQLASKISNSTIDEYYTTAMAAGALGGKVAGAGAGGFLLMFAPPNRHDAIRKSLGPFGINAYQFTYETQGATVKEYD
ncbi:MAG: GHMP kinase [Rhodospirillaceae bacterium]|jgi:D-glycero-alpha-D-manno-heptose-7-phosphate kinase|nr:GHMP kinase [Rhodospirillaceae bacterium]|tara:strand:+ start:3142 stop:4134 length:993 start_codon:yes stop_codon:yes gene_type:complete